MCTLEKHLGEAVLMSTHNVCLGLKIRRIVYACIPQSYYIKLGSKGVDIIHMLP